jgi:hypothetical protein
MKRIALTGSCDHERTVLTNALAIMTGFDPVLCPPYAQLAIKYGLDMERSACQWPDSYIYCLGAFTERIIVEQQYADRFVSDGGVLKELAWIKCRYPQVELIYEQSMIRSLERIITEYAKNGYDSIFHLQPVSGPDTTGHCLRTLFEQYHIPHQIIDPANKENALQRMTDFLEIKPVLSAMHALLKAERQQNFV